MRRARTLAPWILLVAALLGYLTVLQLRATDRPPAVVLWHGGPDDAPARHPVTGRWSWAGPAQRDAEIERIRSERGGRPTFDLDADAPGGLMSRVVDVEDTRIALIELPDDEAAALPRLLSELGPVALALVATNAPPLELPALAGGAPVVVLPGRFAPGAPGDAELSWDLTAAPGAPLVAPWVDGRWRIGRLDLERAPLAATASAVQLPMETAPEDAPIRLGAGGPELALDTIRLKQAGLGRALADAMVEATGADLALLNHLSVRADLVGEIDMIRLEEALPFHNQVVLVTLTGAQIEGLLAENDAQDTRYLLAGGLSEGEGGAWRDRAGAALDPSRDYRVATVDYLANGGRGKRAVFLEGRDPLRTGLFTDRLALDLLQP